MKARLWATLLARALSATCVREKVKTFSLDLLARHHTSSIPLASAPGLPVLNTLNDKTLKPRASTIRSVNQERVDKPFH